MASEQPTQLWYTQTWVAILALVLFFPVGLFLMWRFTSWEAWVKTVITAAGALLAIIIIVAAAAGGGDDDDGDVVTQEATPSPTGEAVVPTPEPMIDTEATATAEAEESAATTATAEAESLAATATAEAEQQAGVGLSRDDPVPAGQSFVVPEGWEVTVVDFIPDATAAVLQENEFNDPPAPGRKFAIVAIRGTNISAEGSAPGDPSDFDPDFAFRLVGSLNVQYSTFENDCGVIPGDFIFRNTVAFPDGTIEGNICFEVGETETDFVLFTAFLESFGDENRRWFAVQ